MTNKIFKVICKNNKYKSVIYNRIYFAEYFSHSLRIYNLDGVYISLYNQDNFISLDEFRQQRLNKILNDY